MHLCLISGVQCALSSAMAGVKAVTQSNIRAWGWSNEGGGGFKEGPVGVKDSAIQGGYSCYCCYVMQTTLSCLRIICMQSCACCFMLCAHGNTQKLCLCCRLHPCVYRLGVYCELGPTRSKSIDVIGFNGGLDYLQKNQEPVFPSTLHKCLGLGSCRKDCRLS